MEQIIGKRLKIDIKSIDTDAKTVTAVVSHIKGDRDGDVIPPSSMKKRIGSYKANPVLLADHNYSLDNHIGQAKSIKINDDNVEAKLQYFAGMKNDDGSPKNPKADWAWELAQKGLGAYSIGFKAFDYDYIKETVKDGDQTYQNITGRNFKDIELLEISHVVVPANANALQMSIDNPDTSIETRELCELVLKGLKSGEIKGPKIDTDPAGGEDGMDVPVPKNMKELIAKIKELKSPGDDMANMQAQFELMDKRISAVETIVSQCESMYAKLQGILVDLQETVDGIQAAQTTATLGPNGTDVNEDPADNGMLPAKGFRHYSEALFGKAGPEKTKQQPQESLSLVSNRLKCLIKRSP